MMKLYSIVNENLVILCGIGLVLSIGPDPNEVIEENVNKPQVPYPDGEFDVHYSENPGRRS